MASSDIVISKIEDVTVVDFKSESILDGLSVEAIAGALYRLVDEQAQRKIVLDFGHVRFLSSQMLSVLIALHKKSDAIGGKLILCGLRPDLRKVFKIMQIDAMLAFAKSERDALKMFGIQTQP